MKAQYDIDSGAIEIRFPDGTEITMLVNEIADDMDIPRPQASICPERKNAPAIFGFVWNRYVALIFLI